jgi:hypothetical protein
MRRLRTREEFQFFGALYRAARGAGAPNGRITILVSHRLSTVRMATSSS